MDERRVFAVAIASLLLWDERDEGKLEKLLDGWMYRNLLTDDQAAEVVEVVANWPVGACH